MRKLSDYPHLASRLFNTPLMIQPEKLDYIMSAFEQKVEDPPDRDYQYLLIAAEPYETCGFKLQSREVDRREGRYWTWWDADAKEFWCQVLFKTERDERYSNVPGLAPAGGGKR